MSFDPISEMITKIKNAQSLQKKQVAISYSKLKLEILKILKTSGYIADFKKTSDGNKNNLEVSLKYVSKKPAITFLKQISKPSRRVYTKLRQIPKVVPRLGLVILSTPKGILTAEQARKIGVGGEIICEIS